MLITAPRRARFLLPGLLLASLLGACLPTYDPEEVTFADQNNGDGNNGAPAGCEDPQAEVCDGADNDCDGQIDEDFPRRGVPCGNNIGACAGVTLCEGGAEVCFQVQAPAEELCDGLDNDCDGQTDELTQEDPANCGVCGNVCAFDNATAGCAAGQCALLTCDEGFEDCDRDLSNGCETDTTVDPTNCGACGNICSFEFADTACVAGACLIEGCQAGRTDCNGVALDGCEADLALDAFNCGACGQQCTLPNAESQCLERACAFVQCQDGFADTDAQPNNGCEVGLRLLGSPPDADLGNLAITPTALLGSAGERLYGYELDPQGAIGPLRFDLALGGPVQQLDADGATLYASQQAGDILILDTSDPAEVVTRGLVVTSGPAPGFARRAGQLFVADGRDGLRVVDISDPSEPRPIGQAPAPDVVTQVLLSGERAVLSTPGRADIYLYDVSTPGQPRYLSAWPTQAGFDRAVFSGDLLITGATGQSTLRLYRVADAQVTFLGQTALSGPLVNLEQRFPFLVAVVQGPGGAVNLDLVDIRRPQRPTIANTYTAAVPNPARSAAFGPSQVFVAGARGLQRLDISDLRQPAGLQDLVRPAELRDVTLQGQRLYVVDGGVVEVMDNTNLQNPRRVARLGQGVRRARVTPELLVTLGDTWPVAGFALNALADGAAPAFILADVPQPLDVEVSASGRYLYALYNGELRTLDPAPLDGAPSTLATFSFEGASCRRLLRNGTTLYVACNTGLYVIRPDAPEVLTNLGNQGGGDLYALHLFGQTLYGLNDGGVAVYSAQAPDAVSLSGNVTFEGLSGLRTLTGVGAWMAAGQGARLHLISRATLTNPVPVAVRNLPGGVAALASDGQQFYAGTSQGVLRLGVEAP
jgi:hypothetical protein